MIYTTGSYTSDGGPVHFLAGERFFGYTEERFPVSVRYPYRLVAVNELESRQTRDTVKHWMDNGVQVMLDSGIYNLAMGHARAHNIHMDQALKMPPSEIDGFTQLRDAYYEAGALLGSSLWGMVELDLGGPEVKPVTRAQIIADTGIVPIPVYHPLGDGWDYYDELASTYDRICWGNVVQARPRDRQRLLMTAAHRARAYPHLWTHFLGVTPSPLTVSLKVKGSTDSSTWLSPVRWGQNHATSLATNVSEYDRSMSAMGQPVTSLAYLECKTQFFLRNLRESYK